MVGYTFIYLIVLLAGDTRGRFSIEALNSCGLAGFVRILYLYYEITKYLLNCESNFYSILI